MNKAAIAAGEGSSSVGKSIVLVNVYILLALAFGIIVGLGAWFFNFIRNR